MQQIRRNQIRHSLNSVTYETVLRECQSVFQKEVLGQCPIRQREDICDTWKERKPVG